MRVKLTSSCIWNVPPEDEEVARDLIKNEPKDVVLEYLQDALIGKDEELVQFKVVVAEFMQ